MLRCLIACSLAFLLLCGCGGDNDGTDSTTDSASVDGSTDGVVVDGTATDGSGTDGNPEIVRPTVDDTAQRAKVREMSIAKLVEALGDSALSGAASDELASRGGDAVKPLIDALDSSDTDIQQRAVFTLGLLGAEAKDALPKLKELAVESNSEVVQDSARFAVDAIEGN